MAEATFWLEHGQQFPYADGFAPSDAADKAALAVVANLCDRRGIKQELRAVDNDVRLDMLRDLAEIIRAAYGVGGTDGETKPPSDAEGPSLEDIDAARELLRLGPLKDLR